jgi:hypothetical protein
MYFFVVLPTKIKKNLYNCIDKKINKLDFLLSFFPQETQNKDTNLNLKLLLRYGSQTALKLLFCTSSYLYLYIECATIILFTNDVCYIYTLCLMSYKTIVGWNTTSELECNFLIKTEKESKVSSIHTIH